MTTTELLSLLQFNQRWTLRTLPSGLSTVADRQHLLGLYAGIEAGEVSTFEVAAIVGGYYIPGATAGQGYIAGARTADSYAAGAVKGQGAPKST